MGLCRMAEYIVTCIRPTFCHHQMFAAITVSVRCFCITCAIVAICNKMFHIDEAIICVCYLSEGRDAYHYEWSVTITQK